MHRELGQCGEGARALINTKCEEYLSGRLLMGTLNWVLEVRERQPRLYACFADVKINLRL